MAYVGALREVGLARILIVDDSESDRVLLQRILERAGHTVLVAEGGEEVVRTHVGTGIDIVITDLQMPQIHGLELITVLRSLTPRPTIVAISSTGEAQLEMARMLGATETLQKPIDARSLIALLDRLGFR